MERDARLLGELSPVAETLLERHLATARPWYPHELVPWSRGRDYVPGDMAAASLPAGVRSALVVNLLTEDGLPLYFAALLRAFGEDHPWGAWARRWTAEEMRHATVIHDYLAVSRLVDLATLERDRMAWLQRAGIPGQPTALESFVYLALQELATRIAHRNTGARLGDPAGERVMARVAADENLHHVFYRDVVSAAVELDPSAAVCAIDAQVRSFGMPGAEIPGFAAHQRAIAGERIFSAVTLHEQVFGALLRHWRMAEVGGLSGEAERARERVLRFLDRFARIASRLDGSASASRPGGAAAPRGNS